MRNRQLILALSLSALAMLGMVGCSDKPADVASQGAAKPGAEIKVDSWGPQEVLAGGSFNVQPNGKSAIWIKATGQSPSAGIQVLLGDKPLDEIFASEQLVTGAVPGAMLEQPGDLTLVLVEAATKRKVTVGTFKVLPKQAK